MVCSNPKIGKSYHVSFYFGRLWLHLLVEFKKGICESFQYCETVESKFLFCETYHSWQRGANENLNGLARQYFPKNCDFTTISDNQIVDIQNKLNNRPRKKIRL